MQKLLVLLTILFFNTYNLIAQCAMCKAGAEQSLERGAQDANWLNYGIFLLMLLPVMMVLGFFYWLRKVDKSETSSAADRQDT